MIHSSIGQSCHYPPLLLSIVLFIFSNSLLVSLNILSHSGSSINVSTISCADKYSSENSYKHKSNIISIGFMIKWTQKCFVNLLVKELSQYSVEKLLDNLSSYIGYDKIHSEKCLVICMVSSQGNQAINEVDKWHMVLISIM